MHGLNSLETHYISRIRPTSQSVQALSFFAPFPYSEPEFLISTMDRHKDWAVIVCLVSGGQEINTGEAGLPEWFDALRRSFSHWDIYITPQLNDDEYRRDRSWSSMIDRLRTFGCDTLHLATSIRSFRTSALAAFTKAMLDVDVDKAKVYISALKISIRLYSREI